MRGIGLLVGVSTLAVGVLLAGCGSDDDDSGTGGTAGSSTGGSAGSGTGGGTGGSSGSTGGGGSGATCSGDTCTTDDSCPWPVQCTCNTCGKSFGPARKCVEGCCLELEKCCDYACAQP